MFLSEEVSRTFQIVVLRKKRSKACREKSADAIVVEYSITLHEGLNLYSRPSKRRHRIFHIALREELVLKI